MFDFIHGNKRLVQVILALIALPFAFFGVESYMRDSNGADFVASVGDYRISQQEFAEALRDQQERLRSMAGGKIDPQLLQSPELKQAVIESLVQQRLLLRDAVGDGLAVTDTQLRNAIAEIPGFQEDGKFSLARYQGFLRSQNLTGPQFDARLKQGLLVTQKSDLFARTALVPSSVAERLLRISEQKREVSSAVIAPARFVPAIKITPEAVKEYYEGHLSEFQNPEQVRAEYLVLSLDDLTQQTAVSAEEAKAYYDQHSAQFKVPEERKASHILITVANDAKPEAKSAARAQAERLYAEAKQNPASFGELARKNSQDPGSAAQDGDLGYFSAGMMVKPFEDAVFKMKPGEIAGLVESPFGFHIIRLDDIKPAKGSSFDEARGGIELEIKKQKAAKKFAEAAEIFSNTVYEQSDSLKPAADALGLALQQSPPLTRKGGGTLPLLNNEKFLQALFSDEVLKDKRNSEAIEVAPNTLMAARVIEHKAASTRPLGEVGAQIKERLTLQQAAQLAANEGKAKLAQLREGKDAGVSWSAPQTISRQNPGDLNHNAAKEAFRADAAKFPAYTGVENGEGGFTLLKISRIIEADKIDPEKRKAFMSQLEQLVGQEDLAAYLDSLKREAEVQIRQEVLAKGER